MTELVTAVNAWSDAIDRGLIMPTDRLLAMATVDRRIDRMLVANPFRSAPVLTVRRLLGKGEAALPSGPGQRTQITPTRLRRHDPVDPRAIERACRRYDRALARAAKAMGMDRPPVITSFPLLAAYAPFEWAGPVTYFGWDDWTAHPGLRPWWPAYRTAYERIRERGHRVAAVSQVLLDRLAPTGASALVPNGVDPAEWLSPAGAPAWFADLPAPRILYVGTLDHRLDVDAVIEVARRFRHGAVVLIGNLVDGERLAPLRREPNVRIAGPVDRRTIVAMIHASEACVMPHHRDPLTEAMSPLKLYEYLAGGRPTVASQLPPVRSIDERIVLVPDGASYADGVATALARGPLGEDERLAFVAANSWDARIELLLGLSIGQPGMAAAASSRTGQESFS